MFDLEERRRHLGYIDNFIEQLKKDKDTIQNLVIIYDYKYPDGSTDWSSMYMGNMNAVIGLMHRYSERIYHSDFQDNGNIFKDIEEE